MLEVNNKKRILFISGHMRIGGVERALVSILKNIDYSRFDITLLLTENGDEYLQEVPGEVRVIQTPLEECFDSFKSLMLSVWRSKQARFKLKFRLAWKLSPYIGNWIFRACGEELGLNEKYDAVVAFRPGFSTKLASALKCSKKLAWWHFGGMYENPKERQQLLASWLPFNHVITVSEEEAAILRKMSSQLETKVRVINNIVDAEDIKIQSGDVDTSYLSNCFHIVSVSRLVIEKRFEIIPAVAALLKAAGIRFQWHIIGDGPRRPQIEEAIIANDVSDCVILHGNKSNPYPWVKHADVMVHVSPTESFGLVLAEAMVLGTPCIAVESEGSRELINKKNGIRVNFSADEIAKAILSVINNPTRLNEMRTEATESVKAYSPEVILPKLYALFD